MSRGGKSKDRADGPERKCIVTGEAQPRHGLIRFVVGPDATIVPDITGRLPGRGMYVSAEKSALSRLYGKKSPFARAARQQVIVPDNLAETVESMVSRRLVDLISLARKAGDAVAGYEKVKDWLLKDQAQVLIQASDGSTRGKSKLSTPEGGSFIGWMTADELGMAFGRETVIHAALAAGGLGRKVVEEAARLRGIRGWTPERGGKKDGGRGRLEG